MDRRRLVLVLCCLAQFMVILDVSIVNVALPSISADLGFSGADLQWVVNAYTLTFAGFLLLGGRAADLLGRRRVFVARAAAVRGRVARRRAGAERAACSSAARAAQGLGGAIVAPGDARDPHDDLLRGRRAQPRARPRGAPWAALGGATGALLGGVLTELLSWRWILIVNVPIGLALAAVAVRVRGRRPARHGRARAASTSPGR